MLAEEIKRGVLLKAEDLNTDPESFLDEVCSKIDELEKYMSCTHDLAHSEIESIIQRLTCFTLLIPIPLPAGIPLIRARKFNPGNDSPEHFNYVSALSYIPKDSFYKPPVMRMSSQGNSVFYATINDNPNSYGTMLSEMRAEKGDQYKILKSETRTLGPSERFYVVHIGVLDYCRRGIPHPFHLGKSFDGVYDLLLKMVHPPAMAALCQCDAFLTDLLKRQTPEKTEVMTEDMAAEITEKKNRLYNVTSAISEECLKPTEVDGIMYPSTRFEGFPNIALKPNSVDTKVVYKKALSLEIKEKYRYGMYETKVLSVGKINDQLIEWDDSEDALIYNKSLDDVIEEARAINTQQTLFVQFVMCNDGRSSGCLSPMGLKGVIGLPLDKYQSMGSISLMAEKHGIIWSHVFADITDIPNTEDSRAAFFALIQGQGGNESIHVPFYFNDGRRIKLRRNEVEKRKGERKGVAS